jgi:hypothetical protein
MQAASKAYGPQALDSNELMPTKPFRWRRSDIIVCNREDYLSASSMRFWV